MSRFDYAWNGDVEIPVTRVVRNNTGDTGMMSGYGPIKVMRAQLRVFGVSGTGPTLDVTIQDTLNSGQTYNTIATFPQMTAQGVSVVDVTTPFSDNIRIRWVIGGVSPTFDFEVRWMIEP